MPTAPSRSTVTKASSPDVLSDLFADELTAQAVSDFEDFMADVY